MKESDEHMSRKYTVRAVNPASPPARTSRGRVIPWSKDKNGRHLTDYESGVRLTVARVPGATKKRWYIKLSYVGDRVEEEGKGTKGYIGSGGRVVSDPGRALAWTSEKEAMNAASSSLDEARKANPGHARQIIVDRDPYCVDDYTKSDGTQVDGYCVDATRYSMRDPGTPGRRSRGAKKGPFSAAKGYRPWIQREGKLGGPGYTKRPQDERHRILRGCVEEYGYRSCLGSIEVLLRNSEIAKKTREALSKDKEWLMDSYGEEISDNPWDDGPIEWTPIKSLRSRMPEGWVIKYDSGEYVVYRRGSPESQWYYTDDGEDAVNTANFEASRGRKSNRGSSMKNPGRSYPIIHGVIGDANPIEHWGGVVLDTGDGPYVIYFQSYGGDGDGEERVSIFSVHIEDDVIQDLNWVDFEAVSNSSGVSISDIEEAARSKNVLARASVYELVAGYYGWGELTAGEFSDITMEEAEEEYGGLVDRAHDEDRENRSRAAKKVTKEGRKTNASRGIKKRLLK